MLFWAKLLNKRVKGREANHQSMFGQYKVKLIKGKW